MPDTPAGLAVSVACIWLVLLALFHLVPAIDIAVQHLFFKSASCPTGSDQIVCGSFPLARSGLLGHLRMALYYLPFIVALFLIVRLWAAFRRPVRVNAVDRRRMAILLATYGLGPGLLVNLLLKGFSGRPRPFQTDLFGGTLSFEPAGSFAGACGSNCSFVSGEAAGGMWLICAALLLPEKWRMRLFPVVCVLALTGALLRIGFGRHYLSDVVLGALSTLVVFTVICAGVGWRASPKSHQ